MSRYPRHILAFLSLSIGSLFTAPAAAATLQKVEQSVWGISGLPSYVNMYIYVPDKLAAKPPILVASHHCQGTGMGTYNETRSTLVPLADKNGFIMIFPEATGHNCWDVGSNKSLKHDGFGDTHAIAQMVRYTLDKYDGDAGRVYAFGGSSGAMMTQALMGIYPDMFMAGVAVSGVPCGCWAQGYSGDVAANGQWSNPCAGGTVTKTARQWGDLVRSMFPSYTGHRPRLQLWHGMPDPTIDYNNMGEAIKEWTNVLDLSATPSATDTARANTTHQTWKNKACDYTVLEAFSIAGAGHGVQWDTPTVANFLGLANVVSQDPETAACGTAVPGGGGKDAGVGDAGAGSPGGSTSGMGRDAGTDATLAGGMSTTGGTAGTGGASPGRGPGPAGASGGMAAGATTGAGGSVGPGAAQAGGGTTGQGSAGTGASIDDENGTADDGCSLALGGRRNDFGGAEGALILLGLSIALRRVVPGRRRRYGSRMRDRRAREERLR